MNAIRSAALRTKNFVTNNKAPLAFAAGVASTGAVAVKIVKGVVAQRDEFLAENGLLEKFYETLNENV